MATESGRGAYNQIEIYNKRLAKLAGNVGVKISDITDQPEEVDVDTSGMTPYEKGRYEATLLLSNVREDTKTLDSLNQGQTRQRAAVSNRVRRNLRDAKVAMENLRKDSKKAGTLDDFAELEKHYKKTENMYKQRFRGAHSTAAEEEERLNDGQVSRYGTTNARSLDDIRNDAGGGGGGNYDAEDLQDPADDEEFQCYFQRSQQKDQEIDQGLDVVHQSLLRVKQNAEDFSTELETQNQYLDRINDKADRMVHEMTGLNTKLKSTLKEVDKQKYCCYMICLMLVLGVLGVVLTQTGVLRKKK